MIAGNNHNVHSELENDQEFLQLADLIDMQEQLENAIENLDEINFDSIQFCSMLQTPDQALPFMAYKIFTKYDILKKFHIDLETFYTFTKEISHGYFKENPFHSVAHIVDSIQAMHYFLNVGNLES